MKFLLRFLLWGSGLFTVAWFVQHAWQDLLLSIVLPLVTPSGPHLERLIFSYPSFPIDLALFAALCLASPGISWEERGRALAKGLPWLLGVELIVTGVVARILVGYALAHRDAATVEGAYTPMFFQLLRASGIGPPLLVWYAALGWKGEAEAVRSA